MSGAAVSGAAVSGGGQRILLTLSYDGTDYLGWQRQPGYQGVSVQQRVEEALRQVSGQRTVVHCAGRTDAGVHAWGQRCHFDCQQAVPLEKWPLLLNRHLPPAIRVRAAQPVAADFHARYHAMGKVYSYLIESFAPASAFGGRYSWQIERELDVAAMVRAAAPLLGRHDFRHYTLSKVSVTNFVRELRRLEISQPEPTTPLFPWQGLHRPLLIEVEGSGFLYKMVRLIVGRLVAVGWGQLPESAVAGFLEGSFWQNIPPAPARGLMLKEVLYPEDRGGIGE